MCGIENFYTVTSLDEYKNIVSSWRGVPQYPISGMGYKGEESKTMTTVYRGHANSTWELEPSVFRDNYLEKEDDIWVLGKEKVQEEFPGVDDDFDKLAIMQHYGLPTRLLDFTFDYNVALYFACCSHPGSDGEVIAVRANDEEPDSLEVKTLTQFVPLKYNLAGAGDILREKLNRNIPDRRLAYLCMHNYLIFPMISNPRLKLQKGAFVAFGEGRAAGTKGKNNFFDDTYGLRGYIQYIKIPSSAKGRILEELNTIGINKDYVYPDGEDWKYLLKKL